MPKTCRKQRCFDCPEININTTISWDGFNPYSCCTVLNRSYVMNTAPGADAPPHRPGDLSMERPGRLYKPLQQASCAVNQRQCAVASGATAWCSPSPTEPHTHAPLRGRMQQRALVLFTSEKSNIRAHTRSMLQRLSGRS